MDAFGSLPPLAPGERAYATPPSALRTSSSAGWGDLAAEIAGTAVKLAIVAAVVKFLFFT